MQLKREKILENVSEIMIDIYLVGYSKQGESIIFILYANKPKYKVLYSIVIDCFEEEVNATRELLDEILTDKLDMLVWTHPHDDHTKGIIQLIDDYCSRDTKIILANILGGKNIKLSKECKVAEKKISSMNKRLKYRYDINDMVHFDNELKSIVFCNADSLKNMEVRCIAPIAGINAKQYVKKNVKANDICVAVIIELELKNNKKMNFMFSGDVENEVFAEIDKMQEDCDIPNTYNFIKIPHHGGRSSENIKKILSQENKSEYAATTVFIKDAKEESTANPEIELLKEYKDYIEDIGCTSDVIKDAFGLGVIRINYSLRLYAGRSGMHHRVDAFGSAVEKIV